MRLDRAIDRYIGELPGRESLRRRAGLTGSSSMGSDKIENIEDVTRLDCVQYLDPPPRSCAGRGFAGRRNWTL